MSSRARWLVALVSFAAWSQCLGQPLTLYVSTQGNDAWSGKLADPNAAKTDGPFATLERARDAVRQVKKRGGPPKGGVAVELRGGIYERFSTLELTKDDAGTAGSPIVYRARKGEVVRLVGGKVVRGWRPVSDPAVLNRLNGPACSQVLQADLRAQGVSDFGIVARRDPRKDKAGMRLEVFFQDKPMTLARWPNEGFVKIVEMIGEPYKRDRHVTHKVGHWVYDGDRPRRWVGEKDAWVHGYWFHDWSDQRHKIKAIDTAARTIEILPPYHGYGYRKGKWYYALNLLSELDQPGEWYLDRERGILYFWPPAPIHQGEAMVSVVSTMVSMLDVSHVTLRGLLLECMRGTAIIIRGGTDNHVVGCTIRNGGEDAVGLSGGTKSGVYGCDIYDMGGSGVNLNAGNRKTLDPAGLYAENNHIHHYGRWYRMYKKAVGIGGVGNIARHNLMHNAPHQAMGFGGNDHLIEFNEIHSVCYESNDAGAIYSGRNWTMRGNVIRHNYLHHINGFEGRGCVGVYLDDSFSSADIVGNVFYKVTRAAMIGGGRDCSIVNNVFVDCVPSVHVDARGLGWANRYIVPGGTWYMQKKLADIKHDQPPYSTRYPHLANILDDEPYAPKYDLVARNIIMGDRWDSIRAKAKPGVTLKDNLINEDPHFVDAANADFRLRDDSPAFRLGFKRIPIEKIGLYKDERRASWPVTHAVRPMAVPPKPEPLHKGPRPVFRVPLAESTIQVDGVISAAEWAGADPKKAMVIQEGVRADKQKPASYAWLAHDGRCLYVAVRNDVNAKTPLKTGAEWGQDDAVEIALRNPAGGAKAPIVVLRGFAKGQLVSSDEAGAPFEVTRDANDATTYAAKVIGPGRWDAEFRIDLTKIGVDPGKPANIPFNLSARKTAHLQWIMWYGTGGYTFAVDKAGYIALVK